MRTLYRRDARDDQGSIILALLGIVILTTVASVGLSAVVNGQHQTRHDDTFAQSLNNAESGVDAMVATIKSACNSGVVSTSTAPCSGVSGPGYSVTTSRSNAIDQSGNAASSVWTITSTGTSTVQGNTVTRTVTEVVTIAHTYHAPVLGTSNLSLPAGSGVGNYQIGLANASNPTGAATPTQSVPISSGVTLSLLGIPGLTTGSIGSTTISNVPTGASPGAAESGGTLSLQNSDLQNFAQVALDNGDTCTGEALAGSGSNMCTSSTVVSEPSPTPVINPNGCLAGAGASVNGAPVLDIPNNILVLNTNVVADNFYNAGIQEVCTSLPLVIPTIGSNLNTLTTLPLLGPLLGLTGLAGTVDVPIGSSCTSVPGGVLSTLSKTVATGNLSCAMNDPASLVFNVVGGAPVYLGTSSSVPTYISGVINNPDGTCYIDGNVVLYGAVNCKSIQAAPGATNVSLTVYYPTDEPALQYADTAHKDTVLNWNESGA